jgi:hypothetical protein
MHDPESAALGQQPDAKRIQSMAGRTAMKRRSRNSGRPLTIAGPRSAEALKDADVSQSPDYTVTGTPDGGLVLTNVEVAAIFWGSYWSTPPASSPSSDTYYQAFTGLVTGPYMTGLRQYRGVGPGTMVGKFINDSSDPSDGYSDDDVVNMLTSFFHANGSVPTLANDHQRFYAVVTPPGINNSLSGAGGQHQTFTYNRVTAYYCWVNSIGGRPNLSPTAWLTSFPTNWWKPAQIRSATPSWSTVACPMAGKSRTTRSATPAITSSPSWR